VRAAAFGEVLENSAPAEATDANDANVYYALCPNPPPGHGANGFVRCANELRFSLSDGAGISLLDVGRGNLDLPSANDDASFNETDVDPALGQLMFGTTRFAERRMIFDDAADRLAHLKGMFAETTPLISAAIESANADAVVQTTLYERNGAKEWSSGRVALLGDAAHCMYPSLGLGISTAFADAVELDAQLRRVKDDDPRLDVRDALAAYSRNRAPYARALQTVSRVMHAVLAATAEKPATSASRRWSAFDPSAAFFKMWRGALWVFGDR
jgi:2-polyprenyl-6-methoxyphenol hydroxylase-like FAD-dependent oxidoreductase